MQITTITLPGDLVDELMSEVNAKSKTEAVIRAVKDEIKARKKERIIKMAGNMEFTNTATSLRHEDERLG
ncbi:DUF2191 domain-containing protein [bacterium]|nr:DUF2191 domain-containing protein [bacterium]